MFARYYLYIGFILFSECSSPNRESLEVHDTPENDVEGYTGVTILDSIPTGDMLDAFEGRIN